MTHILHGWVASEAHFMSGQSIHGSQVGTEMHVNWMSLIPMPQRRFRDSSVAQL